MTWDEICADPLLANLPYKIESDRWGNIVMSPPAAADHADFAAEIIRFLNQMLPGGRAIPECPIQTHDGVKSTDAAWMSHERRRLRPRGQTYHKLAPEICVEVRSPDNSLEQMREKIQLYFGVGAHECWLCDQRGRMTFHNSAGSIPRSRLCPGFPLKLKLAHED